MSSSSIFNKNLLTLLSNKSNLLSEMPIGTTLSLSGNARLEILPLWQAFLVQTLAANWADKLSAFHPFRYRFLCILFLNFLNS